MVGFASKQNKKNLPLKNCNLPPEPPPPLTDNDCVPFPLSLPFPATIACFPAVPFVPPELLAFGCGPSAVGDEADEDEDAGEDCGETPTTGSCCCCWSWWWWWCAAAAAAAAADGDSRIVAVPLTVVVVVAVVVPTSSVIVAHFVRILLIISWLAAAAELPLELELELLPVLELVG